MSQAAKLLIAAAAALVLTVAHHFYGAWVYQTPWRHHVGLMVVPVLVLLIVSYVVHRRRLALRSGLTAGYALASITALVPIAWIGVFEGGYSHLLKNVLYFGGLRGPPFERLFPAPTYEVPGDLVFEASGILQAVIAAYAAAVLFGFVRELRRCDVAQPLGANVRDPRVPSP